MPHRIYDRLFRIRLCVCSQHTLYQQRNNDSECLSLVPAGRTLQVMTFQSAEPFSHVDSYSSEEISLSILHIGSVCSKPCHWFPFPSSPFLQAPPPQLLLPPPSPPICSPPYVRWASISNHAQAVGSITQGHLDSWCSHPQ